jgi:hypothetical protein
MFSSAQPSIADAGMPNSDKLRGLPRWPLVCCDADANCCLLSPIFLMRGAQVCAVDSRHSLITCLLWQ